MTSEIESMKTNEFLRRRKLRLQQVREQSKDIAKKIRQRANVEKLRQTVDIDAKKQKEYFARQEKLVKRLEELYAKGVESVGASHRSASGISQQDAVTKTDLSKLRAKEAAAELKRKRQEKLDEQKRLLDRKLQAREVANELSREKSSVIANKLLTKTSTSKDDANRELVTTDITKESQGEQDQEKPEAVKKNDMATQWDSEEQPNEWEQAIPTLSLPKDDRDSLKESDINLLESKSDKSKRHDLFAVSKEMPSCLRGGNTNLPDERPPIRPSLTLVSEYLQSRGLRLRESEIPHSQKKSTDDLHSLKQTIQRTRTSKLEGRCFNVCHVLDEQVIPVPMWQAETKCQICPDKIFKRRHTIDCKQFECNTNSQINRIFSSIRPARQDLMPSPVLRGNSPFRRNKISQGLISGKDTAHPSRKNSQGKDLQRKNSVSMYSHSTRNVQDIPYHDENHVVRDVPSEEDAFSQAAKEASAGNTRDKHQNKIQDMRNKVAMTKQSVEKEYKDTMNFLSSLPKEKCSKAVKNSYMDDRRQKEVKENRQRTLQQEYNKIDKECRRHNCNKRRSKSKSPVTVNLETGYENSDFQYSWMPVPESDSNLAIHTIPTTTKEGKSGNTVKFSKVDSYHEYRSRHKHTPPTKETTSSHKSPNKKVVEAVFVDENSIESINSSTSSATSSVENLRLEKSKNNKSDQNLSDAERIIIYKILDSRSDIKSKKKTKLMNDIAKSLTSFEKGDTINEGRTNTERVKLQKTNENVTKPAENRVSFEHLQEGIYKTVNEKGNNLTSMYFDNKLEDDDRAITGNRTQSDKSCCYKTCCYKTPKKDSGEKGTVLEWNCGDDPQNARAHDSTCTKCTSTTKLRTNIDVHSAPTPSTTSLINAANDKTTNSLPDGGFIKLVDEAGVDAGKFYIGATGFLKDDAYEMVIQLRKKNANDEKLHEDKELTKATTITHEINKNLENNKGFHLTNKVINANDLREADFEEREIIDTHLSASTESIQVDVPDTINTYAENEETSQNFKQKNNESRNNVCAVKSVTVKTDVVDKSVGTSFQLSYAIPIDVPRTEPLPRAATSTFTQTTLSSPHHRPVLIHMSSSTSTAYMSPPEMVLPMFLRRDYTSNDDESYEPIQRVDIRKKHKYGAQHEDCNCKRCVNVRKAQRKCSTHILYTKNDLGKKIMNTPPNTARSCTSGNRNRPRGCKYKLMMDACHGDPTLVGYKTKCKCPKCVAHFLSDTGSKTGSFKCNHNRGNKYSSHKAHTQASGNFTPRNKNIANPNVKNKAKLNPIVKSYVNKLLNLNKEGLKVIEIADQDCSSVATPGSSIIDVPCNVDERKSSITKTISLEQIKNMLKQQIIAEHESQTLKKDNTNYSGCQIKKNWKPFLPRKPRLIPVHKIKSLNISKHLLKNKTTAAQIKSKRLISTTTTDDNFNLLRPSVPTKSKYRSRSSPTPRHVCVSETASRFTDCDLIGTKKSIKPDKNLDKRQYDNKKLIINKQPNIVQHTETQSRLHRATLTSTSPDSESTGLSRKYKPHIPVSMSTQTSQNLDSEISFMKVAEDKLQNMEKIADLTEKCTKRLSNLAKVLEEVRKNKSLAYSQISTSDTTSDSGDKLEKAPTPVQNIHDDAETKSRDLNSVSEKAEDYPAQLEFPPFLKDIPKPTPLKENMDNAGQIKLNTDTNLGSVSENIFELPMNNKINTELSSKYRTKPPPALCRVNLKHTQEQVVPHELSTVLEVDSPMSVKHRSSRNETKTDGFDSFKTPIAVDQGKNSEKCNIYTGNNVHPDLLGSNVALGVHQSKSSSTDSPDDSKLQMIDLKQFNKIMLEPFVSIHEYAKQYKIEHLDEGANIDEGQKDVIHDDISSLHSDGSLPDVIAELLKRNIITEPFKFDTASNINSTSISTESTMSLLPLSKARKDKKKSMSMNKEYIGETSDSLSMSSNPDLENAFKKLGMGWASSTLKKTKERLALSSSSNTSSSNVSLLKNKIHNQEIPALITDSVSSVLNLSRKGLSSRINTENSKNVEQQTSLPNAMTVREFLTNELAKKITFTSRSKKNDTEEEFVSLFETKIPDEMKHVSGANEEHSLSPSGNRARTSTPVQLFKSITYHSSSSSNMSNGLFSNADDLSSVKMTSNSMKNHSTSDKDDLTVPNFSLRMKKSSDCSKSD